MTVPPKKVLWAIQQLKQHQSSEDFAALIAGAQRLARAHTVARAHEAAELRALRSMPYIGKVELEIAGGQILQDPRVVQLNTGDFGTLLALSAGGDDEAAVLFGELGFAGTMTGLDARAARSSVPSVWQAWSKAPTRACR